MSQPLFCVSDAFFQSLFINYINFQLLNQEDTVKGMVKNVEETNDKLSVLLQFAVTNNIPVAPSPPPVTTMENESRDLGKRSRDLFEIAEKCSC